MRTKLTVALSLILISLMIAFLLVGCARHKGNEEVTPVMVSDVVSIGSNNTGRVYSGTIDPNATVPVSFTVSGYVREIHNVIGSNGFPRLVQQGDRVRKGTMLARIRDVDYAATVNQAAAQVAGKVALTEQAQYGMQQAQAALDRATSGISEANAALVQARTVLAQAKSGLAASQSQLVEAKASALEASAGIERAKAEQEKAQSDYVRAEHLYSSNSMTRADYDSAKAQMGVTEAQLESAKEQFNASNTNIEQAKIQIQSNHAKMDEALAVIARNQATIKSAAAQRNEALAAVNGAKAEVQASAAGIRAAKAQLNQAQTPLGDTRLTAPMDGIVLKRNVEIGTLVGSGTVGFIMADDSSVKVVFGVPDVTVNNIRVGDPATVRVQAYEGRVFTGKVTAVSPAADQSSHVFQIEVTLPNSTRMLKVGMIAKIEFAGLASSCSGSTAVPLSAIVDYPGSSKDYAVYVVKEEHGKLVSRVRKVIIGETCGNKIQIISGVGSGDRIITNGATIVRDGGLVAIVQ